VYLYQGNPIEGWQVAGWDEERFSRLAKTSKQLGDIGQSPIVNAGGVMECFHADLPMDKNWNSRMKFKFSV
jgi:hypothetical protein